MRFWSGGERFQVHRTYRGKICSITAKLDEDPQSKTSGQWLMLMHADHVPTIDDRWAPEDFVLTIAREWISDWKVAIDQVLGPRREG